MKLHLSKIWRKLAFACTAAMSTPAVLTVATGTLFVLENSSAKTTEILEEDKTYIGVST